MVVGGGVARWGGMGVGRDEGGVGWGCWKEDSTGREGGRGGGWERGGGGTGVAFAMVIVFFSALVQW